MSAPLLTADVVARAVVASARVFDVSPADVFDRAKTPVKVRLAAAVALQRAGFATGPIAARCCGVASYVQLAPSQWGKYGLTQEIVDRVLAPFAPYRTPSAAPADEAPKVSRVVRVPENPKATLERLAPKPVVGRIGQAEPAERFDRGRGAGIVSAQTSPFSQSSKGFEAPQRLLRDRIMEALRERPCTISTLTILLDAKELIVGQVLAQLRHEGVVQTEGQGRAAQWSLAMAEAAE